MYGGDAPGTTSWLVHRKNLPQFCLYGNCGWWRSLKMPGSKGSRGRNLCFRFVGLILSAATWGFHCAEGSVRLKSASDRSVSTRGFASVVAKATEGMGRRSSFSFFEKSLTHADSRRAGSDPGGKKYFFVSFCLPEKWGVSAKWSRGLLATFSRSIHCNTECKLRSVIRRDG